MSAGAKHHILIAGGGIGGLAAALALLARGHDVDVYEQAPPSERQAYQTAGQALRTSDERTLTDEEIDQFLPKSMQAAARSARA